MSGSGREYDFKLVDWDSLKFPKNFDALKIPKDIVLRLTPENVEKLGAIAVPNHGGPNRDILFLTFPKNTTGTHPRQGFTRETWWDGTPGEHPRQQVELGSLFHGEEQGCNKESVRTARIHRESFKAVWELAMARKNAK